ncbi:UPF0147 family protein [Candidatus Woesearchaeota archaeon]|nr:UPF0147 family protein [Candidatus Woesearchaeota archaeon]
MTTLNDVEAKLQALIADNLVPKSVKDVAQELIKILKSDEDKVLKITKCLEKLDEVAEDPNIPAFTRTQIWNITSLLESCK